MARNLLFIVAEQWRGDALAHLGNRDFTTPALTALAARGITFANHLSVANPCGPARASLLTGTHVQTHRVTRNGVPLDSTLETMPGLLRAAGYDPALVGYTTTVLDPRRRSPGDPAFRTSGDLMEGWRAMRTLAPARRPYFTYLERHGQPCQGSPDHHLHSRQPLPGEDKQALDRPHAIPPGLTDSAWLADAALDFISQERHRPFALHLGFFRPHPPFVAAADDLEHALAMTSGEPAGTDDPDPLARFLRVKTTMTEFFPHRSDPLGSMTTREHRHARAQYSALIADVDRQIGRVLAGLAEHGLEKDTLVVFTADHGEMLGDHGLYGKIGFWRPAFHVPLIIVDPGQSHRVGTIWKGVTGSVDVLPTVLGGLGIPIPVQCDGIDLRRHVDNAASAGGHRAVMLETWLPENEDPMLFGETAILDDGETVLVQSSGGGTRLYDLTSDPHQRFDKAADQRWASRLTRMMQHLLCYRMRHADRRLSSFRTGPDGLTQGSELVGTSAWPRFP